MTADALDFPDDDEVFFAEEEEDSSSFESGEFWKVMIVDDEDEIHNVTRLALGGFIYERRRLEFISAYSGREAKELIRKHDDTAMIILDVVMEDEYSGLDVTRYIRDILGNRMVRIVLRTGQPGQAPEEKIIIDYDINDYKEKTELTSQKLFTTVVASLRSYSHLYSIELSRKGLEQIIESTGSLCQLKSFEKFINGVFTQLISLLRLSQNSLYCQTAGFATSHSDGNLVIIAGTGIYSEQINKSVSNNIPEAIIQNLKDTANTKKSLYFDDHCVIYLGSDSSNDNMIYLERNEKLDQNDIYMMELFCKNIGIAFENLIER